MDTTDSILINSSNITLLQLKSDTVDLNIMHVGVIPMFLESYILNNDIFYTSSTSKHLDGSEADIVLINNDCDMASKVLNTIDKLQLIVTYTTVIYIKTRTSFIHFSLVPILLKYLVKIKKSVSFFNKTIAQNTSEMFLNN